MRTPLYYLLAPVLLTSLQSYAVPASVANDYLDLDLRFDFTVDQSVLTGQFRAPAGGWCYEPLSIPCIVSESYSPLYVRNGELFYGQNGDWFSVQHLYSVSLDGGDITSYYYNENLQAVSEVPLPPVGLMLFSMTSMFLATMSRRRKQTLNSH